MVKKSSGWNLQEMQETLVKDTEQRISDGFQEIASAGPKPTENIGDGKTRPSSISPQPSEKEPTKGVQADVPMSLYLRLNAIKYRRNQPLCALMVEALQMWADIQDGK
jgi:hypothetical protein